MAWEKVSLFKTFQRQKRVVFKQGRTNVVIFAVGIDIWAVENRCPHQGFPLDDGILDEKTCVLTCNRHFWEFNLKTGDGLTGGFLPTYRTKVEEDYLWVEV